MPPQPGRLWPPAHGVTLCRWLACAGTTADHSLRGAHCSSIISRKPPPAKGAALYVVAVDGSHRAHAGVEFAASVARADDKIVLLHVENDNKEGPFSRVYWPATAA